MKTTVPRAYRGVIGATRVGVVACAVVSGLATGLAATAPAAAAEVGTARVATRTVGMPTVTVTEREFTVAVAVARPGPLRPGTYRFVVVNKGAFPHALSVAGNGMATRSTAMIAPGRTATLVVRLGAGSVRLWCPMPGHAALGMRAVLRVRT